MRFQPWHQCVSHSTPVDRWCETIIPILAAYDGSQFRCLEHLCDHLTGWGAGPPEIFFVYKHIKEFHHPRVEQFGKVVHICQFIHPLNQMGILFERWSLVRELSCEVIYPSLAAGAEVVHLTVTYLNLIVAKPIFFAPHLGPIYLYTTIPASGGHYRAVDVFNIGACR